MEPLRGIHTTGEDRDKSKVEDSLKQIQEEKPTSLVNVSDEKRVVPKPSLGQRIITEIKHYFNGFRLLVLEVGIASRTLWKYLNGKPVMRREQKQFTRAVSDIFRMLPFSVFILVPFAEFLLPVALRFFPNMLPSTFETKGDKQSRLKKKLAVKLEMSKFLQGAMEDIAVRTKKSSKSAEAAQSFHAFVQKIRDQKDMISNEEIIKHAKFFEMEVTLNNLPRDQLIALCKLLTIPAVGTNAAMRLMIDLKLSSLLADDKMIQEEGGIKKLTTEELVSACQERGMRALGLSRQRLEVQLKEWIDLHVNEKVPASLLLISRIIYLNENVPMSHRLKEAIGTLPENAAEEAMVRAAEVHLERVDNTTRYKAVKQEQELIKQERKAELEEMIEAKAVPDMIKVENIMDKAKQQLPHKITQEDIDLLLLAMTAASKNMQTLREAKHELLELQEDMIEYKDDLSSLKSMLAEGKNDNLIKKDVKASNRINKRLQKLVLNMEKTIGDLEKAEEIGLKQKEKYRLTFDDILGSLKHVEEMPVDRLMAIFETLDTNKDGKIEIGEARKVIYALNAEDVAVTPQQLALVVALFAKQTEVEKLQKVPVKEQFVKEQAKAS